MKRWTIGTLLFSGLICVSAAQAITVDEVVQLSQTGAGDNVILAQIQADSTVFHLTVQEILDLKDAGVSDQVITFMINTGKSLGVVQETVPYVEEETVVEEPVAEPTSSGYVDMGVSPGGISFSVGFGFGYYYPSWPGYSWSWYCDPFYWAGWPSYYAYWAPWPGSYYCYAPNYYCRYGYAYGGYWGGYYGGYWGGYYPSYAYYGGRNIGNRGPVGGYDRTYKDPSPGGAAAASRTLARKQQRVGTPRDGVHDYARLDTSRPETRSRASAGTPSRRGTAADVKVIRSRPTKERVSQNRPTSRSRSSASTPRSSRGSSSRVQRQAPSASRPSARSTGKVKQAPAKRQVKRAPSKGKAKPAPSRSTVRSAPRTRSAPARGSVRSAPRGGSSRGGGARVSRGGGGSRSSGGGRRH